MLEFYKNKLEQLKDQHPKATGVIRSIERTIMEMEGAQQ